jgi:hypothetical protein
MPALSRSPASLLKNLDFTHHAVAGVLSVNAWFRQLSASD